MSTQVVALSRSALAQVAPNYEAMRTAIAQCERVDEIADLSDKAVAAQAYFRQSQDVENEMHASRIRVRAERRLGEILKAMAERGEQATVLGIGPLQRATRCQESKPKPVWDEIYGLARSTREDTLRVLLRAKPDLGDSSSPDQAADALRYGLLRQEWATDIPLKWVAY